MKDVSTEVIDETSPYLADVKKLWRRNSETLGFFPKGAFQEHAAKKSIVVAVSAQKNVVGYLLYRSVRYAAGWPIAVIVHLCVANSERGRGVARALVEALRQLTSGSFLRIELKCRRDFEANKMWPNIGFTYGGEETGRVGLPLVRWHISFRDLPLMAFLRQRSLSKRFLAVIDSNVLFCLQDSILPSTPLEERILKEEAKALLADWLDDDVTIAITGETINEIERNDDPRERERRRAFSEGFPRVEFSPDTQKNALEGLKACFPKALTDNAKSDIVLISQAIAANAYCVITQDKGLLRKAEAVESKFGTKVMAPGEFVSDVDEVIREAQYQPALFGGSHRLIRSNLHGRLSPALYDRLRDSTTSEKKSEFESRLRAFMAQPARYELLLYSRSSEDPLVLIILDRASTTELSVPMIRVAWTPLAETVLRYVLRQITMTSFNEKRVVTTVSDRSSGERFNEAFEELGFSLMDNNWVKCNVKFVGPSKDLVAHLEVPKNSRMAAAFCDAVKRSIQQPDSLGLVDIERRLWPAKVLDADIRNYLISIKPEWAQHLFDEELATQTLWGAKEERLLRHENVYYRRYRYPTEVTGPARILWYVTKDNNRPGSMQVKACSFLDEVITGKAQTLFKRFERLGAYEWSDILRGAANEPSNSLMALRFSSTEVFPHPIGFQDLRRIIDEEDDKGLCLQSPHTISAGAFSRLYRNGMGMN